MHRLGLIVVALVLGGCQGTARHAWTDVLSKCAATDTIPTAKLLYLSPSNSIGPGSAWRRADDGVYGLRFTLPDAIGDAATREAMIDAGPPATCDGTSNQSWSLSASALLSTPVAPIGAELAAEIDRSTQTTVSVTSWRWHHLKQLSYEGWAKSSASGDFGRDVLSGDRLVMTDAVLVEGFKTTLHFTTAVAASLKGILPTEAGQLKAGLQTRWANDTTLEIESPGPTYIAGLLRPITPQEGIRSAPGQRSTAGALDIPETQRARREPLK